MGFGLTFRYFPNTWKWLASLSWYWWPLVAIGLGIVGSVTETIVWGGAILVWEWITGREAFADELTETT
jgi:hypothetical protein